MLLAAAAIALRGEPARACGGWDGPTYYDFMTFEPSITGDNLGLYFDPMVIGFGDACVDCAVSAQLADWHGYFKGAVADADWKQILFPEKQNAVVAIQTRLARKGDRARDALAYVDFAHKVEPFATTLADAPVPGALVAEATSAWKAARDRFLQQRYAYQVLRLVFYQRDWAAAVAFYDHNQAALAGPSADLAWRARYYLAGASRRAGNRARANLELARIVAGYPALGNVAANDFKPMEEADWKQSLQLARDVKDKVALWRAVGVKTDGMVAMREIQKLDPRSSVLALLLVRELSRVEPLGEPVWGSPPEPKDVAARGKAFAALEKIATKIVATPGADRPWLAELVLGHIAAKRGDVADARAHLDRALQARPTDARVANQAKASLALALAQSWKIDPAREDELAKTFNAIDAKFGRYHAVRAEVRGRLAKAYAAAGRWIDAELLEPGTAGKRWHDRAFIEQLIARSGQTSTEFDKLVLQGSITRATLDRELGLRELLDGNFAHAAQLLRPHTDKLGTDPFVAGILDCHDCDHDKYANAPWTTASVASRLVELERAAKGTGDTAARASIELGNALYNITWFGNARGMVFDTNQRTSDTRPAERWYKRAFDVARTRELKAKAAWLAAKAELGRLENVDMDSPWGYSDALPTPRTWYPVMKTFADTRYYKDVVAQCGMFARWLR
ncbi:MAG: hypothetical protein ACM31C_14945 [Acidobacteriota bacterium]